MRIPDAEPEKTTVPSVAFSRVKSASHRPWPGTAKVSVAFVREYSHTRKGAPYAVPMVSALTESRMLTACSAVSVVHVMLCP